MGKELIDKLSKLKLAETTLKRSLDIGFSQKEKQKIFNELEYVRKEIELIKFKLQLEKEINK